MEFESSTKLKIDDEVTEFVKDAIRVEIVKGFENPEQIIAQIVKEALEIQVESSKGGYKKISLLSKTINDLIASEANKLLLELLKKYRPKIREALKRRLDRKGGFTDMVINGLKEGIEEKLSVQISLNIGRRW